MRFVCIFAAPRTGSNQLCRLLRSCKWMNVKGELFHPKWVGRLEHDERWCLYGLSDGAALDGEGLCRWRNANAGLTMDMLYRMDPRTLVFKLFNGHLNHERIAREIFARDDIAYLVLRRRPIESYISVQKAMAVSKFCQVDTTAVSPTLDVGEFLEWAKRVRGWYDRIERELTARSLPFLRLSYEEHINVGDDETARGVALQGLESLGVTGPEPRRTLRPLMRQDRSGRYQDRVANWQTFESAMRGTPEHAALLDWAEAA